jgi:hypothetical protein
MTNNIVTWRESIHPNRTSATVVVVAMLAGALVVLWPSIYSLTTWPGL